MELGVLTGVIRRQLSSMLQYAITAIVLILLILKVSGMITMRLHTSQPVEIAGEDRCKEKDCENLEHVTNIYGDFVRDGLIFGEGSN